MRGIFNFPLYTFLETPSSCVYSVLYLNYSYLSDNSKKNITRGRCLWRFGCICCLHRNPLLARRCSKKTPFWNYIFGHTILPGNFIQHRSIAIRHDHTVFEKHHFKVISRRNQGQQEIRITRYGNSAVFGRH